MFKRNKVRGTRLDETTLRTYLHSTYNSPELKQEKIINGFKPFLQANYGGTNDCTLCSISSIASFKDKYNKPFNDIYDKVEAVAAYHCYSPERFGTIPIFIKSIIDKSFKTKSKAYYLKNIGYNWNTVKTLVDKNIPFVLSTSVLTVFQL